VGYYVISHGVHKRRLCCNKISAFKIKATALALGKKIQLKNWKTGGLNQFLNKIDDIDSDNKTFYVYQSSNETDDYRR